MSAPGRDVGSAMEKAVADIRAKEFGPKSLGFYIQILFMLGAVVAIASCGAWNVLLVILFYIPLTALSMTKRFFWNWTERLLRRDAEAGRTSRAVWWDYLCVAIDWAMGFLMFAAVAFGVFALARGSGMPRTAMWLCVAGLYTLPFAFMRKGPGYEWGNFVFWEQWCVVAILVASAFLPIGPALGVTLQFGTAALVGVPLACVRKHKVIVGKVKAYRDNAIAAKAVGREPPPSIDQFPLAQIAMSALEGIRFRWGVLVVTVGALVAGLAWTLVLRRPTAILFAVLAAAVGYVAQIFVSCPMLKTKDEISKRRLDVDLVRDFVEFRMLFTMLPLFAVSVVILWMGGRDVAMLVALSLIAVGACNVFASEEVPGEGDSADWLFVVVYAAAFASLCALRVAGLRWWQCLTPIPTFAYVVPAIRWFFPRSGLRGTERMAAIADMPNRLKADIRSESERIRDEKAEKRRRRNERRLANFRRSRGER